LIQLEIQTTTLTCLFDFLFRFFWVGLTIFFGGPLYNWLIGYLRFCCNDALWQFFMPD